jgi:nicotinamide riboside transporter PnuC
MSTGVKKTLLAFVLTLAAQAMGIIVIAACADGRDETVLLGLIVVLLFVLVVSVIYHRGSAVRS